MGQISYIFLALKILLKNLLPLHLIDSQSYFMKFLNYNFILAIIFISNLNFAYSQCSVSFNTVPTLGEGCDVLGVQFNSTISGTTLGTPSWDFGDGSTKFNGKNPFHNYTTLSKDTSFTVTLTVSCLDGSTTVKKGNVTVFAKPKANFDFPSTEICTFSDTLKPINSSTGNSLSYKWDFGDNSTSSEKNPKHTFSVASTYIVLLEVTNEKGCKDKTQKSITTKPAPNAEFTLDNFLACQPMSVVATNITQNDDQSQTTKFEWAASNGSKISNTSPVSFNFSDYGVQEITLKVTNNLGCTNSTSANVLVKQSPRIIASNIPSAPICYDKPFEIKLQSDPNNASIVWKSNETASVTDSLSKTTFISFSSGGEQSITAKLSYNGCTTDTILKFTIFEKPVLSLDYNPKVLCEEEQTLVTAQPSDLRSYVFKNNNAVLKSDQNTAVFNKLVLVNKVTLQAVDNSGCPLSSDITIQAKDKPQISLTSNAVKDTICINQELEVSAAPTSLDNYRFTINGIEQASGKDNTFKIPTVNEPMSIKVIAEQNGCFDTTQLNTIYAKLPSPAPSINCIESGFDYITFGFDKVQGGNAYEISINQGAFVSTNGKQLYTAQSLSPNTEYTAQVRVKLPHQSPCDSMVFSEIATCKTIPCEKLDFELDPLISKFCENGTATFSISDIVSPSGKYNIYWNNTRSSATSFTLGNLNTQNSPYTVTVSVEDTTRSAECKIITKKSIIYVDKIPDSTSFLYAYAVDDLCKPEPYLELSVINPNPTYSYSFAKNNPPDNWSPSNRLPYEIPDSLVYLKIQSPHGACSTIIQKPIEAQDLKEIALVSIDSLVNTIEDSTQCGFATWTYYLHTGLDSSILDNLKKYFPNLSSFSITRETTFKDERPVKDEIASFKADQIPLIFKFSKDLSSGDSYTFRDSVTFYNENNCPIAFSWGTSIKIDRPDDCNPQPYLYCSNRKDTITIEDMEEFLSCLEVLKDNVNYFAEKPVGYSLIDSFTVVRNLDTSSTSLYIKNKYYKCFETNVEVCSFTCDTALYIPNAITPNSDLKNDKWEIKFANGQVSLKIFNRWEQLVYHSDHYQNTFEGVSNDGVLLPDGVYYYELQINGSSHLREEKFGRTAKNLEEVINKDYSINAYDCDAKPYENLKGKLLIQR